MASTISALRKAADDMVDIMKRTGGDGGPNMRAVMDKHRRRHVEVTARIRAKDTEAAQKALTHKSGRGPGLLADVTRAHRQDAALDVALFGEHDLAGHIHAVRSRDGREGPVTLEELRETPVDREVLKKALRHELGERLDPRKLGERELKAFLSEEVTQQVMEMMGINPDAEAAEDGKKAVKEAVTPMVNEIAELYKDRT